MNGEVELLEMYRHWKGMVIDMEQEKTGFIKDYVVMDMETTGLNPKLDKIIEIGAARVRDGKVEKTFSTYINPGRSLSPRVSALTGIQDEELESAPFIEDVLPEFLTFVGDDYLLGHNLIFDYSFVKKAAVNQKLSFDKEGMDTLRIARRFLTDLESRRLGFLCEYYQIPLHAHRALHDAIATHELYQKLVESFYAKEADTFAPKKLVYQVKKEGPVTPRQKEFIRKLCEQNHIVIKENVIWIPALQDFPDKIDIERLTKNEASRLIDRLRAYFASKCEE